MLQALLNFIGSLQRDAWFASTSLIMVMIVVAFPSHGLGQNGPIQISLGDRHANHYPNALVGGATPQKTARLAKRVILASCSVTQNQQSKLQLKSPPNLKTLEGVGNRPQEPATKLPTLQTPQTPLNPLNVRDSDGPMTQRTRNPATQKAEIFKEPGYNKFDWSTQTPGLAPNSRSSDQESKRVYALPEIASVREPISAMPLTGILQSDPSHLLSQDEDKDPPHRIVQRETTYAELSGVPAQFKIKTWQPHNFYHQPLYFEQPNLERFGNQRVFQNMDSTIHFFSTIPVLPLLVLKDHPRERIYTHGDGRPGDCTDYRIVRHFHPRQHAACDR